MRSRHLRVRLITILGPLSNRHPPDPDFRLAPEGNKRVLVTSNTTGISGNADSFSSLLRTGTPVKVLVVSHARPRFPAGDRDGRLMRLSVFSLIKTLYLASFGRLGM